MLFLPLVNYTVSWSYLAFLYLVIPLLTKGNSGEDNRFKEIAKIAKGKRTIYQIIR